jgi:hypothetical protein
MEICQWQSSIASHDFNTSSSCATEKNRKVKISSGTFSLDGIHRLDSTDTTLSQSTQSGQHYYYYYGTDTHLQYGFDQTFRRNGVAAAGGYE